MDLGKIWMQDVARKGLPLVWLGVSAPLILAAIPVPATEPVRKLLWPFLRRGKLHGSEGSDSSTAGKKRRTWKTVTVPRSFFTHFYLLGLFSNSLGLFTALAFAGACSRPASVQSKLSSSVAERLTGAGRSDLLSGYGDLDPKYRREVWKLAFLLLVFEVHLIRRLYECLFVSSVDPSSRMNFLGYLIGMAFYVAVPATLFLQAFADEVLVGAFHAFVKQTLVGKFSLADTQPEVLEGAHYLLGTLGWAPYMGGIVCLYGMIHQYKCHEILAAIRSGGRHQRYQQDGTSFGKRNNEYGIPRGDWFELVSCPHFFAEILIYVGFLVISGGTNPAMWILLLGVASNLVVIANPTHDWYLSKFDDYPRTRHPIFPYVG